MTTFLIDKILSSECKTHTTITIPQEIESYSVADSLNIAFGKSHTINDVVSEILDCYYNPLDSIQKNNRPYIEYDLEKPVMIEKRSININKAKSLIGYSPKWNLSDGIKETVDWYEYTRNR